MDLAYSQEHEAYRDEVRRFLENNKDKAPGSGSTAQDWQQLLIENGYAARTIPTEYGGAGQEPDILKSHILAEEFAHAKVPPGHSGDNRIVPVLLELGTEEQKQRFIGPTIRGEMQWCQGYSEPGSGSDLASLQTKAHVDGDDFVINGQKIWTSGAKTAHMMFCLVRTEPDAPKHQGISYLLIPMGTPGMDVRPLKQMTGDSFFNEVFFTDCRVPTTEIIGKRGEGWNVANATLKHERGGLGDPNQAESRFRDILELMKTETIDGQRLIDIPSFRDRAMALQARVLAMKFNGMRVLSHTIKGEEPGLPRWIVKLQGCELNHQTAALAIDVMGELGILYDESPYVRNHGMWQHRYMMDLGLIIGGGTAQIQKNIIGERALGLPKEPKFDKPI
ncbi:MAG: acyl-CoA dehydrogenase family protein [Gammaproteobacteria bacterium]|nr:acyl-CoA dehydrogenase family protein [Gammaproteobacteria bacterium]